MLQRRKNSDSVRGKSLFPLFPFFTLLMTVSILAILSLALKYGDLFTNKRMTFPLNDRNAQYKLICSEIFWIQYLNIDNPEWNKVTLAVGSTKQNLEPLCNQRVEVQMRLRRIFGEPICRLSETSGWCLQDKIPVLDVEDITPK